MHLFLVPSSGDRSCFADKVNWGREEDVQLWEFDLQRTLRNGLIGAIFGPLVRFTM